MKESSEKVWNALKELTDPELPFLTLEDLGVIRKIRTENHNHVITISPTYIGCPAISVIEKKIKNKLKKIGLDAIVEKSFSPPWTSDWISSEGRKKLEEFGIAPPQLKRKATSDITGLDKMKCPQCSSFNTEKVSEFGSTACKSLYRCLDCKEPFDQFKCI